jgi:hypothetical protein
MVLKLGLFRNAAATRTCKFLLFSRTFTNLVTSLKDIAVPSRYMEKQLVRNTLELAEVVLLAKDRDVLMGAGAYDSNS